MLFSTLPFFAFLAVVLVVFHASPPAWRKWVLLAASYFFYMSWNPKFIALLLALTAIDYTAALWIERVPVAWRKSVLVVSLAANIGFLGFFKYYNFLASNVAGALGQPVDSFFLDIVLPLGISFHTFQSMSYVIDVYRREQEPIRHATDYALFISFFPQLVAGPIVRAREFFRDLYHWSAPSPREWQRGVLLIFLGLTKKVALADQAALVVNSYFSNVAAHPGMLTAWTASAAFAIQVYFDFSGYSDMAIGMALLFGFHFPENFRRPFLSDCITEYWHRWNITLSRWLRDYFYISLGGSRRGRWTTYRNLLVTMLISGLWHGAAWHFVAWGGAVGLLMCLERVVGIRPVSSREHPLLYWFRVPVAFAAFVAAIVLFRAPSLGDAAAVYGQMFGGIAGANLLNLWQFGLVVLALSLAVLEESVGWFERLANGPKWAYIGALSLLLVTLELFSVTEISIPFVYFQF